MKPNFMFKHACLAINSCELSLVIFPAHGHSDTILLQKRLLTTVYQAPLSKRSEADSERSICFQLEETQNDLSTSTYNDL